MTVGKASKLRGLMRVAATVALAPWQVGREPIFVVGHGRSGTTWVGNVLARAPRVLYYFEPCGRAINKEGGLDPWFKYLRPGQRDESVEHALDAAFGGLPFPGRRWQRGVWHRLLPGYRIVVKDVATLMATEWVAQRYRANILAVVRHPCAVVLSDLKQGISAEESAAALFRQSELRHDYLEPHLALFESASTPLQLLGAIWAVRHRVFADSLLRHPEWVVIDYETLCAEPVQEYRNFFRLLGLKWSRAVESYVAFSSTSHVPGMFSGVRVSRQQIDKWKDEMEVGDLNAIRSYVEALDLPFYRSDDQWSLARGQ